MGWSFDSPPEREHDSASGFQGKILEVAETPLSCLQIEDDRQSSRAEIRSLTQTVGGSLVAFSALSFAELWAEWAAQNREPWLRGMVSELRARYALASEASTAV